MFLKFNLNLSPNFLYTFTKFSSMLPKFRNFCYFLVCYYFRVDAGRAESVPRGAAWWWKKEAGGPPPLRLQVHEMFAKIPSSSFRNEWMTVRNIETYIRNTEDNFIHSQNCAKAPDERIYFRNIWDQNLQIYVKCREDWLKIILAHFAK